jgi:hypothetical protein
MPKVKMTPPQYKYGGMRATPTKDAHRYESAEHQYEGAAPPNERIAHHTLFQKVQKIKGYKYPGIIVSIFMTLDHRVRYVVEADPDSDFRGMLHIFNDNDIEER